MRHLYYVGSGCIIVVSFLLALLVFGEVIDNRLGILTAVDMRYVKAYKEQGGRLEQLASRLYRVTGWRAEHTHEFFWTLVACDARKANGDWVVLAWEVGHYTSPDPSVPMRRLQLVPLTRGAAELTPELSPLGLLPADYPQGALLHAGALFGWARGHCPAGHVPGCSDDPH